MRQRWNVSCSGPAPHLKLLGKVVLIGAEDERDHWPVLDSRMWGFELQARYIQVMLSGSYLRGLPIWIPFLTFASFMFVVEGLPTLLEALIPAGKDHWFLTHAYTLPDRVYCPCARSRVSPASCCVWRYLPGGNYATAPLCRRIHWLSADSTEQERDTMTVPVKSTPNSNPIGGEGGTPGLEIEATETLSETIIVKATPQPTNPIGGEGGTPGVD
jgi:hypothetical protein